MTLKFSSSYKAIQVGMLDGSNLARSINKYSKAVGLVDNLLQMFNIVEKDYFGLYYLSDKESGAVSSSDSYIKKHRHFFVHLQNSSPELETRILEILDNLSGMHGIAAEAKLIEKAIPSVQYGMEAFHVRSEAHPSLRRLALTVCPIGIMIYQDYDRMEVFTWTEIWNAGYTRKNFWLRIFRDGENSKHNYILINNKYCKFVWKLFKHYFKFYIKDHGIPPKVAWGRVAPSVDRTNILQVIDNNIGADIHLPHALESGIHRPFPAPTTQL